MSPRSRLEIASPLFCFCAIPFLFFVRFLCRSLLPFLLCSSHSIVSFVFPLHGKCSSLCALLPRFNSMSRWGRFEIPSSLFCFRALPFRFFFFGNIRERKDRLHPEPRSGGVRPRCGASGWRRLKEAGVCCALRNPLHGTFHRLLMSTEALENYLSHLDIPPQWLRNNSSKQKNFSNLVFLVCQINKLVRHKCLQLPNNPKGTCKVNLL